MFTSSLNNSKHFSLLLYSIFSFVLREGSTHEQFLIHSSLTSEWSNHLLIICYVIRSYSLTNGPPEGNSSFCFSNIERCVCFLSWQNDLPHHHTLAIMAQIGSSPPSMPCQGLSQPSCRAKCVQQMTTFHFTCFTLSASFNWRTETASNSMRLIILMRRN